MAVPTRFDRTSALLGLAGSSPILLSLALVVALGRGSSFGEAPIAALVLASLLVAGLAVVIAAPLALVAAVHVVEFAEARERRMIEALFAALAGVPAVVWVFVAVGAAAHPSAALAAGVLALGLTPVMALGCIAALDGVPIELREGAWALGAGRAQAVLTIVIPSAGRGILAAIILGLIRGLGDLVIVALLAGMIPAKGLELGAAAETLAGYAAHQAALGPGPSEGAVFGVAAVLTAIVVALGLARRSLEPGRAR